MQTSHPTPKTAPAPPPASIRNVRIWDLPTRLFHWLLLLCVIGLFATAYIPGARIEWHERLGYVLLTLLLFRLAWGFVGGHWSRFGNFIPPRGRVIVAGHTALGALAVGVMLLALLAQVTTGLVSDDEIAFTGPLNRFISTDLGLAATAWHKNVGQWVLVGLIALHVVAIGFYLLARRNNLITPMVGGDKPVLEPDEGMPTTAVIASSDSARDRWLALAVLALSAGLVYVLVAAGR